MVVGAYIDFKAHSGGPVHSSVRELHNIQATNKSTEKPNRKTNEAATGTLKGSQWAYKLKESLSLVLKIE